MTKVMIINGSPRKNFNTAKLLKEAAHGAEDAGAEVEVVYLYDITYKGCMLLIHSNIRIIQNMIVICLTPFTKPKCVMNSFRLICKKPMRWASVWQP